ncbi:MAG: hypothetical protein GW893_22785 [Armatimonadetes bacterium]|nr:hypothetical protein [Armatimonadota bacterium]
MNLTEPSKPRKPLLPRCMIAASCLLLSVGWVGANVWQGKQQVARLFAQADPAPADQPDAATGAPENGFDVSFRRPEGSAPYHAQIQIGFSHPMVPLTAVTDPQRQETLRNFSLTPDAPGHFRLIGDSAVVFSPEKPFPAATQYTVSVSSKLKDVHGHTLGKNLRWQFQTPSVSIHVSVSGPAGSPENPPAKNAQLALRPTMQLTSNAPLRLSSLQQKAHLRKLSPGGKLQTTGIALSATAAKDNPSPVQDVSASREDYKYTLQPIRSLEKHSSYRLEIAPGVLPEVGNLPASQTVRKAFSTFGPLTFSVSQNSCEGGLLRESYWIDASNPMIDASMNGAIAIAPRLPSGAHLSRLYFDDKELTPDTVYTITISTKVSDVYGQHPASPVQLSFRSANYCPAIKALRGHSIITPVTDPNVPYRVRNPGKLTTRFFGLSEAQLLSAAFGPQVGSVEDFLIRMKERSKPGIESFHTNANVVRWLDLSPCLEASGLGIAFYQMATSYRDCGYDGENGKPVVQSGALLRTNIGLQVHVLPGALSVWATHLTDGSPVSGAEVFVYRRSSEHTPERLTEAVTDATGRLVLAPEDVAKDGRYLSQPDDILITVREGEDYAFATANHFLGNDMGLWNFDVSPGWDGADATSLGALFSDRRLYLDGETVTIKGVIRYRTEDRTVTPSGLSLKATLEEPNGESAPVGDVKTDEFGTFSLEIPTEEGAPLGHYYVRVESEEPSLEWAGSFRLADFRPPRYRARMQTDRDLYTVGDTITATGSGEYLFGAPLAGGDATFVVNAKAAHFQPPNWDGYGFALPDWLEEELEDQESPDKNLISKSDSLDGQGQSHIAIPILAADVPRPMEYSVEVDVKDVSGQSVGASRLVTALPHPRLIGVKLEDSFSPTATAVPSQIIVTDPRGNALPDVPLRVELQSVRWVYRTIKEEDDVYERYVPEFKTVASEKVTSDNTPITVSCTPKETGDYLIRAYFDGHAGTGTEGAGWLYAYGSGLSAAASRDEQENMEVKLKADKEIYDVGEEVSIAVPSPFKEAQLLITVEREKIFWQKQIAVKQGITPVRFTLTREMIPNVFVEAALIERGPANDNLFEKYTHRPYRVGLMQVNVSRESHRLNVSVTPQDKALRPGQTAHVDFQATDCTGKPAQVQLTVMAVDEGILQMTGYRPPDFVEEALPERDLSLSLLDNRPYVIHAGKKIPMHKGYGYGAGGDSEDLAIQEEVRRDFKRLAYFNPDLRTDAEGKASCDFRAPDSLTTWRVMTVAASREIDFGYGDATFVVNQPLLMQKITPRFARVDDSISLGVAVNNQTGADGSARVSYQIVEGASHLLPSDGDRTQTVSVPAGRTIPVRWPCKVVGIGQCVLQFSCKLEGKVAASDSLEVRFNTQAPSQPESVAVVDEVNDTSSVDLHITEDMRTDLGELILSLSSTAFGNLTPDANFLLNYEYGCAEQTGSRLLGLLSVENPVKKFGLQLDTTTPLKKILRSDLKRLLQLQTSDGGFGYWANDSSSFPLSAYIAEVLHAAESRGYDVPNRAANNLKQYLQQYNCQSDDEKWRMHEHVLRAYGLHLLEQPDQTHYAEIYSRKALLSLVDQVRLAMVYRGAREWKQKADELFADIQKSTWMTSRTAHLETQSSPQAEWSFFDSPVSVASLGLRLDLLMDPKDSSASKVATYLIRNRTRRGWRSTYDISRMLDAVGSYIDARESKKPKFRATIELSGSRPTSFDFAGYELGQQLHRVPLRELGRGAHKVQFKKDGRGTLYTTTELRYYPTTQQPPVSEGFYMERSMTNLRTNQTVPSGSDIKVGDIVEIQLTMTAPQNGNHVVVESPIPAGMTAVDTSLDTTPDWQQGEFDSDDWSNWSNPFSHTEQRKDHVALFAEGFAAGVYEYEYLLQAISPGTFLYPPARIYRMYEPEEFGSTGWGTVVIR